MLGFSTYIKQMASLLVICSNDDLAWFIYVPDAYYEESDVIFIVQKYTIDSLQVNILNILDYRAIWSFELFNPLCY